MNDTIYQLSLNQARRLKHKGLFEFMKEVGLRAITLRSLNHGKAKAIHGDFTFHIG